MAYLNERFSMWPHFDEKDTKKVSEILLSGKVNRWTGEENILFETEFSRYIGAKYAIAVANGTLALELALVALDIAPGDEVITTCRTFIASASSVVMRGATPVIADVDPITQNITAETIKPLITNKTKAIICVHHAGWMCDMEAIMPLAEEHGIKVIEDCAQAHGACIKYRPAGTWGDIAAFSFCQDKIMTTGGEGGMVMTKDEELYKKMWEFKDHGKGYDAVFNREHPEGFRWLHDSFGSNYRMTEIQAALGRLALKKLPEWVDTRNKYAHILNTAFCDFSGLQVTIPPDNVYHAYYKYYVLLEPEALKEGWDRERIVSEINSAGVPCMGGSCWNITEEKAFKDIGGTKTAQELPGAAFLKDRSLMFLVHPTLEIDDIHLTIEAVANVMAQAVR